MDKKVETNYNIPSMLFVYGGVYKAKTKTEKSLKLTKILSWSVLSGKFFQFHVSQHFSNPWLLLVYLVF